MTPISISRSSHFSLSRSKLVWQRLVQTPVITLCLRQFCKPCIVLAEHALAAAALVADDLVPFDADERRDVAELAELLRHFVGDEVAVGEDLEVAIAVAAEDLQDLRVHERLAAEDAEERVAHRLGFA